MNPQDFRTWLTTLSPRPLVMGILNVTPDSFSDGGQFASEAAAIAHAREMIEQGADLIDIGGESTRPGSQRVPAAGQIARIVPVIRQIRRESDILISVDTTLGEVAGSAIDAGADILNDISAGREDPAIFDLSAMRDLPLILMHMQGEPGTMQANPVYQDVTREVADFLLSRAKAAHAAGVRRENVLLDPGIGFGKTLEHNLTLLRDTPRFAALGYRLLIGTSRKRFIAAITGRQDPKDRLYGSLASALLALADGANIVRVHDVAPTVQAVKVLDALRGRR